MKMKATWIALALLLSVTLYMSFAATGVTTSGATRISGIDADKTDPFIAYQYTFSNTVAGETDLIPVPLTAKTATVTIQSASLQSGVMGTGVGYKLLSKPAITSATPMAGDSWYPADATTELYSYGKYQFYVEGGGWAQVAGIASATDGVAREITVHFNTE